HCSEAKITPKDVAYGRRFSFIDDEFAVLDVVAERGLAAHPHALLFGCGDLVADARSPVTSRSNWANESSTLSVRRPMLLVVLNAWVTDTNDTPCASKTSTILAKSASDRVSRSTL